jgi:hypothetical protein
MSGDHPTQKLHTRANRRKRLRPGRKEQKFFSHLTENTIQHEVQSANGAYENKDLL